MSEKLKTATQLAKAIGVSVGHARELCRLKKIRSQKVGAMGVLMIHPDDFREFIRTYRQRNTAAREKSVREYVRFYWCAKYDACLESYAKRNGSFDCQTCSRYVRGEKRILTDWEVANCMALLIAVKEQAEADDAEPVGQ